MNKNAIKEAESQPESPLPPGPMVFEETIPGGWNWSHTLRRGRAIRLIAWEPDSCASLLAFNPRDKAERYNMPDTLKAQFVGRLSKGNALYSDMGRVLLSIIGDTGGPHDTIGGLLRQKELERRFGTRGYQEYRNDYFRSTELAFLSEMSKYGLGVQDLSPPVNFFAQSASDEEGRLRYVSNPGLASGTAPLWVDLQAEMDVLVIVCPGVHPLYRGESWKPRAVKVQVWESGIPAYANPAWAFNEQNARGFENSRRYN